LTVAIIQPRPRVRFCVSGKIPAQVKFWEDSAKVRGYVGGVGSGKTFAGAIAALSMPPGTAGVVVGPTYGNMRDTSQRTFFEIVPDDHIISHNKSEQVTQLANGSTIFWRSCDKPKSLRGPNLHWAWMDEAAYCTEDSWRVIIGRLRVTGPRGEQPRAWITTTPAGQNWVYDWWVTKNLGYSLHRGKTTDNPFNAEGYGDDLAEQYADDPAYAAQELEGQFVDLSGSKRLPGPLLASVFKLRAQTTARPNIIIKGTSNRYSLPAETRIYEAPQKGRSYVVGADCAEGLKGGDDSTGVVVDKETGRTVAVLSGEYEPTEEHPAYLAILAQWYDAPVMVERNNHGHAVIGGLARHGVVCLSGSDGRRGYQTTALSKSSAYNTAHAYLLQAKASGVESIPDARLKDQLGGVDRVTLKGPGKGKITKTDDEAVAWVLAQVARGCAPVAQARSRAAMAKLLGGRRR